MAMSAATEMSLELLETTITLCHPDRHPVERADKAGRVTAELLALRPHVKPKAEHQTGDVRFPLWVTGRTAGASGLVVAEAVFLLSIRINSVVEGSSLTLFDAHRETNPSTGEIRPTAGTRYLSIQHRAGIYAKIRGEMVVSFFFLR
jgi:hypothetical protein